MPPAYVKPYVKRGKSDAADAVVNVRYLEWPYRLRRGCLRCILFRIHPGCKVVTTCEAEAQRRRSNPPPGKVWIPPAFATFYLRSGDQPSAIEHRIALTSSYALAR